MRLVTAAKASPHAEFYSLNAEHTYGSNNNFFNYLPKTSIGTRDGVDDTRLKAKNTKKKKIRGQEHRRKCSPKKRSSNKFFRRSPNEENKKGFRKFSARFLAFSYKMLTVQKIVLSSNRGQIIFEDLRLRGQGQKLALRGQGQRLQNVSSRTPPLIGTGNFFKIF